MARVRSEPSMADQSIPAIRQRVADPFTVRAEQPQPGHLPNGGFGPPELRGHSPTACRECRCSSRIRIVTVSITEQDFILNPAAWTQPGPGQFGTAAPYYTDYRYARRPIENLGFGRVFRITERMTMNVRMEFNNVFNRTELPNPDSN